MGALTKDLVYHINRKFAELVGDTQNDSIAATGTNQAGATLLSASINNITTGSDPSNLSVRLPKIEGFPNSFIIVHNSVDPGTMAALDIYPFSGDSIDHNAANTKVTITGRGSKMFFKVSATKWISL